MNTDLWTELGTSAEGIEKLKTFAALAERWTQKINLISKSTIPDIWARHIEDSARIMLQAPKSPKIWADFGSGGGFPGIVVACLLQDRGLDTVVTLVESDQRKAAFLREAKRQLGLDTVIRAERGEAITVIGADVVSARALASLDMLFGFMERHATADAVGLFPKGETWPDEVAQAQKNWLFDLETDEDPRHKGSATLKVRNLRRDSRAALA